MSTIAHLAGLISSFIVHLEFFFFYLSQGIGRVSKGYQTLIRKLQYLNISSGGIAIDLYNFCYFQLLEIQSGQYA